MPSLTRYPLELVVRCGGKQLARCLIRRGRYVLGHDPKHEVEIDEPSISSRHARLSVLSEEEILIEDLGSANGTYVDGQLAETELRISFTSLVQLGNATLEFQRGGLPAAIFDYLPATFLSPRRYELGEEIARGGVSTIQAGRDLALERPVALRTMQPACQRSAVTVIRFIREAQIMAQLQHPHIPPVHELRLNDEGQLQYSTRLLEAESLSAILERLGAGAPSAGHAWSLPTLLGIWQRACEAIAYAHAHGVMHCALRPENIVAGEFGEVMVIGWTFAVLFSPDEKSPRPRVQAPGEPITATVNPCTAPEQAIGMGIFDERVDVYALGALLYAILTGQLPFAHTDETRLAQQIANGGVRAPSIILNPSENGAGERFREGLIGIAMKALSTSPAHRPPSAAALQSEVAEWQSSLAWAEPKGRWTNLGGLLPRR